MNNITNVQADSLNLEFCSACLSKDRQLFSNTDYVYIYKQYFNSSNTMTSKLKFCWECTSFLKKVYLFQKKVQIAQNIINVIAFKQNLPLKSLSRLSISIQNEKAYIEFTDEEIKKENDKVEELKEEPHIKKENISDDSIDNFDDIAIDYDIVDSSDIKRELKEKIKKRKPQKKYLRKFKIVGSKYDDNVIKEVPLQESEIHTYYENEKSNEFYLKGQYRCTKCLMSWSNRKPYNKHMSQCSSRGKVQCSVCGVWLSSSSRLEAHGRRHRAAHACGACGYSCYVRHNLRAHVRTVHGHHFQCTACLLQFEKYSEFLRHHKNNHDKMFCDHCGKKTSSRRLMERHMVNNHIPQACQYCSKLFKGHTALKSHVTQYHGPRDKEDAFCVTCNKQFIHMKSFREHLLSSNAHANERKNARKQVPCPECDKKYARRTNMMNHYRYVHAKQSRYYCQECDKQLLNRTKFVDHQKYVHEGKHRPKDKLCSICGRGFSNNRILMNHMRTHTGERPFECEFCDAKFSQQAALTSHVKHIHLKHKRRTGWPE